MNASMFEIKPNGPDLVAARALPPASSLENTIASVAPYARLGVDYPHQERLVGLFRRLPSQELAEVLDCPRREEPAIFAAAIDSLPMGGPTPAYGTQSSLAPASPTMRGASPRTPRPPSLQ